MTWQRGESTQTKGKASKIPQLFNHQVTNQHVPANSLILVLLPSQHARRQIQKEMYFSWMGRRLGFIAQSRNQNRVWCYVGKIGGYKSSTNAYESEVHQFFSEKKFLKRGFVLKLVPEKQCHGFAYTCVKVKCQIGTP